MFIASRCFNRRSFISSACNQYNSYCSEKCITPVKHRLINIDPGIQSKTNSLCPVQPESPCMLKVAIIGAPNAGKSTFANQILGWKFSAVSSKVHTTRARHIASYVEGNVQIILLDTPGMINPGIRKKFKLDRALLLDPHSSLFESDLIIVVVDISTPWGRDRLDKDILKALHLHAEKRAILVLNKVDLLKDKGLLLQTTRLLTCGLVNSKPIPALSHINSFKGGEISSATKAKRKLERNLLFKKYEESLTNANDECSKILSEEGNQEKEEIAEYGGFEIVSRDLNEVDTWHLYNQQLKYLSRVVEEKKGWHRFEQVFMISSLKNDGLTEIKDYLLGIAPRRDWFYHKAFLTDQNSHTLAEQCIWEKILDCLPGDIAYTISVKLSNWQFGEGLLHTEFQILCKTKRHYNYCKGAGGTMIRKIAILSKQELMNVFRCEMTMKLIIVKLNKK